MCSNLANERDFFILAREWCTGKGFVGFYRETKSASGAKKDFAEEYDFYKTKLCCIEGTSFFEIV